MIQEYKQTLKGMFKFELTSFIGRNFLNRTPDFGNLKNQELYLNLGCGKNLQTAAGGGGII